MSLINDALKKAQKMRQQPMDAGVAADATDSPAPRVPKRRPPVQARRVVAAVASIVAIFAIIAAAALYFLLPDTTPPELVVRPPRVPKGAETAATVSDEPIVTVTAPASLQTAPAGAESDVLGSTAPMTAQVDSASATPAPEAMAAADAPSAAEMTPPSKPVANPQVYDFLDTLRVTGIRASPTDPKVLMNDRVFRLNEIVDRSLGLRLTGISSAALTFEDPSGFQYEKQF